MEENETPKTPEAPEAPEVPETPETPVIPEGYVRAEEVETERTARTAAEEGRTAAETARAQAEARATAAEQRARATEIRMTAQSLNFNDPADAERFVGADVENVAEALAEVLMTKPYLAKQAETPAPVTPTSPTNPARGNALTLEAVKQMTPAQIAANWPAVKAVLGQ